MGRRRRGVPTAARLSSARMRPGPEMKMDPSAIHAVGADDRPDFDDLAQGMHAIAWPRFLRQNAEVSALWPVLSERFARFQFLLYEDDALVACGNAAPFAW